MRGLLWATLFSSPGNMMEICGKHPIRLCQFPATRATLARGSKEMLNASTLPPFCPGPLGLLLQLVETVGRTLTLELDRPEFESRSR